MVCNAFGDRISPICMGQIYVTDLRVIFIPTEISLPMQAETISLIDAEELDEKQMLYLHKYTLQLPLSSVVECKCSLVTASSAESAAPTSSSNLINAADSRFLMSFDVYDRSTMEFLIIKPKPGTTLHASLGSTRPPPRGMALEYGELTDKAIKNTVTKLQNPFYRAGLETNEVDIYSWSTRVADYINFEVRLDSVWVRWAKYMKKTILSFQSTASNSDKAWIKRAKFNSNNILDIDYQRYNIQVSLSIFCFVDVIYSK